MFLTVQVKSYIFLNLTPEMSAICNLLLNIQNYLLTVRVKT